MNFLSTSEQNLDAADAGLIHANLSSVDIGPFLDLLNSSNSFLEEDDIRPSPNNPNASSDARRERQNDDLDLLKLLVVSDEELQQQQQQQQQKKRKQSKPSSPAHPPSPAPSSSSAPSATTSASNNNTSTEQADEDDDGNSIYLIQVKKAFNFLLELNPPRYIKLPILQMISNEQQTGGIKMRNREYYYATIWSLVRFMSYITRQNEQLLSVSQFLTEKRAYAVAAQILFFNNQEFGFEPDKTWNVALQHPEVISDSITAILAKDLIASGKLSAKFAFRATNFTLIRPPILQHTPITLRTTQYAQLADCKYEELRKPAQQARMNEEIFGAVVTAVRAVDQRLDVHRSDEQYADLVEAMYRIPVGAFDDELLSMGAITSSKQAYGSLFVKHVEPLCAIGYFTTSFSHSTEDSFRLSSIPDDAFVQSMTWEGSRVAKFVMKSGHEQIFMWNYPIRETSLLKDTKIIFANDYELAIISICPVEEARLDDVSLGLAREIFNADEILTTPYCGMAGALGLGYVISKGFRSFAGIGNDNDAVAILEYEQIRQDVRSLRSEGLKLSTSAIRIYDMETLALPRIVKRMPSNKKIGLYLAAIKLAANVHDVEENEISYKRPEALPDIEGRNSAQLCYWSSNEEDGKAIEAALRKRLRASQVDLDNLRGVRDGKILAKSSAPLDVFIVIIAAMALAIVPIIVSTGDSASERISTAIRNIGFGAIPIIAVYMAVFYFRWAPYDMLRAQRACATLEEAAKSTGVSVVHVVEELARKGWASEVLATAGAGLALRGGMGHGLISCGVGLSLTEYAKLGVTVLKKDDAIAVVVGRDFTVELNLEAESGMWYASKGKALVGHYVEACEEDMHVLVG